MLGLMFIYSLLACKESAQIKVNYKSGLVQITSKDFQIPKGLKSYIDQDYLKYIRAENPKVIFGDEELLSQAGREFLDVQVSFRSSVDGVLSAHTKFSLPRGGGEIDLKNYVVGEKGSFYMSVAAQRTTELDQEVKNLHVYYLSEAKTRTIAGESFGAGCKKFMDVTYLFQKKNLDGGLQLNATEQRYLSVVAGVFYFVEFSSAQKRYISAVRITDTRYPELLCDQR